MELYNIKVNCIKNCNINKDLSIPCALYYNKELSSNNTPKIICDNKDEIIDDKIFENFLKEVLHDNIIKTRKRINKTNNRKTKKQKK